MAKLLLSLSFIVQLFFGLAYATTTVELFNQKIALLELANGQFSGFNYAFGEVGRKRLIDTFEKNGYEGPFLELLKSGVSLEFNYEKTSYPISDLFGELGYPKYKEKEAIRSEILDLVTLSLADNYSLVLKTLQEYNSMPKKTAGYYIPGNIAYEMVLLIKDLLNKIRSQELPEGLSLNQIEESYEILFWYTQNKVETSNARDAGVSTQALLKRVYPKK